MTLVDLSFAQYRFEPAVLTVYRGDTVSFLQTTRVPHNVEFQRVPEGVNLAAVQRGPFISAPDQTYNILIDKRFKPGTYEYVCTPHVAMGMRGVLRVVARGGATP